MMYYNVKIRFDKDNNKIKGDIGDTMSYDDCVKNMHQYFVDHMDETDCYKISVEIHNAEDERCKVEERQVWTRKEETTVE